MKSQSEHILAALGAGGEWVSSARMVGELGVSRMAVSKQVRRLCGMGYAIESAPGKGYRLVGRSDQPVPEEVLPRLTTKVMGRTYRYFADIASTNSYLRERMRELPEGAVVVADAQSRGRGRFEREWFSPPGKNVYLSVLLKPAVPPVEAPPLSLVAAASVLRAIHEVRRFPSMS